MWVMSKRCFVRMCVTSLRLQMQYGIKTFLKAPLARQTARCLSDFGGSNWLDRQRESSAGTFLFILFILSLQICFCTARRSPRFHLLIPSNKGSGVLLKKHFSRGWLIDAASLIAKWPCFSASEALCRQIWTSINHFHSGLKRMVTRRIGCSPWNCAQSHHRLCFFPVHHSFIHFQCQLLPQIRVTGVSLGLRRLPLGKGRVTHWAGCQFIAGLHNYVYKTHRILQNRIQR